MWISVKNSFSPLFVPWLTHGIEIIMKYLFEKYVLEKWKYYIIIAVSYYLLPLIAYLLIICFTPADEQDPLGAGLILGFIIFIAAPITVFITSIVFAVKNDFKWYFSTVVALLWLPYIIFGALTLIFCGVFFIISVFGQLIGDLKRVL